MNLLQVIRTIEGCARSELAIETIVRNDIFRLNAAPSVRYGVFAWLQGEHRTSVNSSLMEYSFTFFYADRLTENAGNEVEVQSVGIETLENIVRKLNEAGLIPGTYTFNAFNQRFSDECAGVYCNVSLEVEKGGLCAEDYDKEEEDESIDLSFLNPCTGEQSEAPLPEIPSL